MSAAICIRGCANSAAAKAAKTDSTSASTNSPCSVSGTTEPPAVETAPTEVTTTAAAASPYRLTKSNKTGGYQAE